MARREKITQRAYRSSLLLNIDGRRLTHELCGSFSRSADVWDPTKRVTGGPHGVMGSLILVAALVGSAGLLSASIDSPGWMAAVALLPLLLAISACEPLTALACGVVWGASLFAFLALAGHNSASSLTVSPVLLTGVPALYAFAGALFTRRFGFSALMLGLGWAGVELALAPLGFQGGLLVGTFGVGTGGLSGVLHSALGFVCLASFIAAVNGLLLSVLSRAYVRVRRSQRRYVFGSSGVSPRLLPLEVPFESFLYVNPAHARAPPA